MGSASATQSNQLLRSVMRNGLAVATALVAVLGGVRGTQDAVANGDTRTITIKHMHTKEETTVTFKRDGRYVSEALEKLNWAMRDWRTDEPIRMDPRLFDLAWEVQRQVGSEQPFHVVSAYRSPGTNSMLRRRSRAVAKHSQHMLGKAMDFYLPDTPTVKIREAGMRLQRGGVGFYPGAHTPFVHLDAGSVRSWPRMTRDQLVRLFPDEKTVHLPADGHPLGGYELAKADIIARGGAVAGYAAADLDEGAVISSGRKSLWASLFGGDDEEADARPTRGRTSAPKPQPVVMAYAANNAEDGGSRFGLAQSAPSTPAPAPSTLVRDRSNRLAPKVVEPQPVQVAALAPEALPEPKPDNRPKLIDAPVPLARPRGLTLPQAPGDGSEPVQVAALPQAGAQSGALAFAPQIAPGARPGADMKLVLASLPPRRPNEIAAPVDTIIAGRPVAAPMPPSRPTSLPNPVFAELRTGAESDAQPQGRLVTVTHPLPPGRPQTGIAQARIVPATEPVRTFAHTPIAIGYDADKAGLDSLFAAVARPAPSGRSVTVATARTRTNAPLRASPLEAPGSAASLGFSHDEATDTKPGSFTGPAIRPLPTSFVQQN